MKIKKWISGLLIFFFFTNSVFAQVPLAVSPAANILDLKSPIADVQIPAELGTVAHRSQGAGPMVIHVSDAHANYEAQLHIKNILDYLIRMHSVRLVGLEGACAKLRPEIFRLFLDEKVNSAVVDSLVKDGELTGAEFLAIENASKNAPVWTGVEDKNLYLADLAAFRRVHETYESQKDYFEKEKIEIAKLKARVFSEELRKFDAAKYQFEDRRSSFIDYGRALQKAASRYLKLDLTNPKEQKEFSNLVRIAILSRIETDVRKQADQIEKEKSALRSKLGGFDWTTQSPNRRFFETLYGASRKNKVDLNQFPAFKQWAEYEILKSEIDAPALFEEIARLETKLYGALIHTSEERALVSRSENLRLTEKFVRLEVTRQEYEAFHFSGDKQIELLVREAQQFYDLAIKRDSALITNLLKIAREKKLSKVVLVTGGFHSSGISEILKNQQISHITVTPKITSEDKSGNYLRVILDKLSSPLVTGDVATPARIAKLVNLANARGARLLKAASLGEQLSQKPKVSTVDFVVGDSVQGKSLGGVSEVFDFLSQHPAALVAATGIVFAATSIFCISYLDRYRVIDGFEFANNKERTMAKNGLNKLRWALKAAGIAPESVFESGLFQTVFMARDLSELMLYLDFGIKLSEMGVNPNPAYFHVIPQLSHRVQQYRGDLAKMLKILQDTALELKKSGVSNTAIEDIFTNQISRIISEKPSINSMVEAIRKVGRPVSGNSLGKKRPIKYQEFLELPTYIDPEEVMGYRQMNSAGVFFDPVMPLRFYPTFRQSAFSGLDVKNFLKFLEPDEKPVAYGIFRYFMAPSWPALIHHCFFLEDGRLVVICKNFGHEVYKIVQASGPGTRSNPKKDDRGELDERARELLTLNASVIQQYKDWKLIKVSASSLGTRGHRSRGLRDQRKALNNRLIEHHLFHFSSNNWGNKKNSLMVLAQWVQRWPEKFTQRHLDRIRALLADNNENVREQAALTIQEFRKYRHDLFLRGDFAVKGSVYERAQKNGDSTTASSLGRDAGVHRTTIYGDFEHEKELTKISNEHVRNWVRSAAQFLGAKSLEIVDESYRERLLGAEDAANDYVWLSGNPLTGLAGTRHFSGELTDTMKASIKNALNGKELYVIPYFAEKSEGAPAQSGVLLSDDLHVVTQMLLMPHIVVGNAAAERLKTSKHFEKSISLSSASSLGETTEISRQAFEAFLNKHEFGWMTYSHVGFMNGIAPGSPVRVSELSTGIRASVPYIYVIADKNTSGDEIIRALYHSGIIKQPKFQPIRKDLEQFLAREAPKLLAETVFSKIGITDIKKMIAEKGFRETIFENRDSKPAVWVRLTESGESGEAVVVSRERVGNNNRVLGYRLDILFGYYATGEDIVREVLRSNEIRDLNFAPVRRAFEDLARVKAPQLFEFVQGASLGERTKPVKVVVLDLKGTLLDNSGNLIKGVPEIINRLKQRKDLRLVVFTNAKPATIFQVQIKFPLFDGIAFISASELGYSKPSAEAYRELANKLNQKYGVKFDDEVLVVDDEEVNLEAPRGLGWRTVHLTPEQHLNAQPLIQDLLNNVEKPAAGSSLGESAESKIPVQDIQAIIKRESLIELIFGGAILGTSVMIFLTPVLAFEEGVAFNTLLGLTAGISFYGAASWFLGNVLAKPESWGNISRLISQEKFKDVDWGVLFRKADELRRTLILRGIKPGFAFRSLERAIIDVRSGKELLSLLNYGVDIAEKGGEPALIFQVAEYRQKGSAASLGNAGSWDSTANPQISKEDIERVLKARNVQIFWQKTPGERIRFMYSQPPFVLAGKDATPGDVVREILLLPIPSKDEFAVYYSEIQKDIEAFVASKAPGILVRVFVEKEEDARFDSSWRGLESKFKAAGVEYAEILGSAYESVFMQKERVTFMRVMDDRRSNNVEVKLSDFSGVSLDDQIVKVRLSRRTDPAEAIRGALANNDLPKSAREKLSRLSKAITGASLGDEKLSNGEVMVAGVVVSIITVALAVIGVGLLTVGAAFAVVGIPVFGVTLGVFYLGALAHDFFFTNGSFFQRQSLLNAFSFKNRSERSVIDRKLNILRNELVKRDKKNRILFAGNSFTETEEHFRYHVPDLLKKARSASELEAFLDSWIRFAKADKLPWMTFRDYVEQDFLSFSPEVSDTVEYLDKFIDLIFYFLSISKNEYDIVPQLIHRQGYPRNVKEYVGALGLVADFAGRLKEKGISLYTPLHEGVFQILETVKSSEELSSTLDAFGDFVLKLYRSLTPDNADSVLIWSRVDVSRNEKKNIYTKETLELLEALVAHPNFVRAAEDYNWRWIPWDKLLGQLKQIKQRGNSFDVEYRVEGNGGVRTKSIELVETKAQSLGNGKSDAQENAGVLEALERRFEGKKLLRELLGQIVKSKTYWDIRKFTKRIGAKLQPQMGDDLALTPDSDGTVRFQFEGVSIPLKTGDVVIKKTDDPIRTVDNIFYFIHSTPDPTALSSAVQVTFKQIHTGAQFDVLVDREHGLNRPAYFILATAREIELLRKQGFESSGVHGLSLGASEPIRFGLSAENEAKAQAIWKEIMKANGSEAKATLQKIQRLKSFWSSLNELPLIIDIVAANLHTELGASDNQQYSIAIQIYSDVIKKAEKAGTSAIAQLGVALTSRGYAYFQLGKTELAQQDMERGLQITLGSSLGESAESKNSLQVPAVAPVPYDPIKELMKGYEQEPVSVKRTDNIHGAPRKDVLAPGTRENPLKRKSSASGMRNLIDGRGKVGGDQIQRTDNILGAPRKSAPDHRRLSGRSLGQEDGLDNDPPYRDLLQQWYPASSQSRETNAPANCFAFLRKYDEKGEPIFAGVKLSSSNKCTVSVDVFTVDRKAERKNILTQYNCKFSSHPLGFYASEFLVSGIDRLFIDGNQLVIVAVATIHEFVTAGQRGLPSYVKTSELLMPKLVDINELLPKVAGAKAESLGEKVSKKKMDYSKIPFVRISGDEIKFFHQSVKSWLFPDSDMPPSDSLAGQLLRLLTPADRRGFGIPIGMYYWFDRKNAPAHQLSEYGFFFKKGVVIRVSLIMDKHKGTQLEKSERIRLDSYQGEDAEILKNVWRKFSSNASSLGEEEKVSQPVPAVAPVPYDPIKELMKGYEQEPVSIKRTDNIHGAPRKDVLAPGTRENPLKRKSSASGMRNLIDGRGKVGGDQIQRTDNILGTPRKSAPSRRFFGKSLGEESLNAEGRSLGDVIGTIRELAGRVVGRELPSVRDFLYNLVFGEELIARASEDKSLQDFRAEHAEYVKNLPDALYSKAHQEQPELGVLATTSDLYSPEIERQLLVNSKALAVIVFTGAMRDLNAFKKRFARVSDRIIIEPASKPEAGSVMNQILSGSALRKLAGNVKQTVLARHTAVFASSEILSELTALKLSSRLVASDKEGLIQKQLTSFGISESDFRLYGNAVGFLIAKNGGYDALDDEAREGLTRPDGDNWIRFNLSLLGAKIAQLVNEFAGFQAVQQAA